MALHNPNNWHWVNKPCGPWARKYLEGELLQLEVESDGMSAKITKIEEMDGDVDVSQRKGKVITLFDVVLKLAWSGTTKEGEVTDGTIKVPEVAHDTEEEEYVFDIDVTASDSEKEKVRDLVRSQLVPKIRKVLQQLAPALIAEHGKDIQHGPSDSRSSSSSRAAKSIAPVVQTQSRTSTSGKVNTTTLTSSDEFRTSAEQLQRVFTDPQLVTAFTRGPPKVWSGTSKGDKFVIFDGNVEGEFESVTETDIRQKWRLKQWPEGHFSTLNLKFDQNDSAGVTILRVTWDGIPIGQEDVTRRNWAEYYVKSIKICFGYGTVL